MAKQTQASKIAKTVLWVNKIFKGKVTFCGSFGLRLNGKIDREVHDVDCITDKDFYGVKPWTYLPKKYDMLDVYDGHSAKFEVNGVLVKCFKLKSPQGITVDVMFRPDGIKSNVHEYNGQKIKVEMPESAMEVKKYYLDNWAKMQGCTGQSFDKHKNDLESMGITYSPSSIGTSDDLPF